MKIVLGLVLGLSLTSCYAITGGRGLFESYYKVLEQDDFQMTILAVCNVYTCEDIFRQANLTAKEHCNSNKKKYTLSGSYKTGKSQGWAHNRSYRCV